jgi:hypothetical protein
MDLITQHSGFPPGLIIWFVLLMAIIIGRVLHGDIHTTGFMRTAPGCQRHAGANTDCARARARNGAVSCGDR